MPQFLHLKSKQRVVGFDPHLLHRPDVEIVTESEAKSLTRKYSKERAKGHEARERERVREIAKSFGTQLAEDGEGENGEDEEVNLSQPGRRPRQQAIGVTVDQPYDEPDEEQARKAKEGQVPEKVRQSTGAIKETGDRQAHPDSNTNINNDPDIPGGVGEQWQAGQDTRATGPTAGNQPDRPAAEGAEHKAAAAEEQRAADAANRPQPTVLAQRIAEAEKAEEATKGKRGK